MKTKLCVVAIVASLMLWGCTKEEKTTEAPTPELTTTVEQAKEKGQEAIEAVKDTAKAVEEKVEEKAAEVEKKIEPMVEKGKQTVADVKAAVEKKIAPVEPVAETVVIDNKNGKVVLPHKKHAEAQGCPACHGDQKPGPLKLGKDAAHALCLGCHKKNQAGPTSCTKCHQKKAKAVEGY